MSTKKNITVTLRRSLNRRTAKHKACARGLGLTKKIGSSSVIEDTPCNRGMINKISYLLHVEESN